MADIFVLCLGLAYHANVINYWTREGQKLYEMSIKQIFQQGWVQFLDHRSLYSFLDEQLADQVRTYGWTDIITEIPLDLNGIHANVANLITSCGNMSLEQVRHMSPPICQWRTDNRAAQNSMQIYQCIFNSLSKLTHAIITLQKVEDMLIGVGNDEAQVKQLEANAANYTLNASLPGTSCTRNSLRDNVRNIKPAWMTEPPTSDNPQKKSTNGEGYH